MKRFLTPSRKRVLDFDRCEERTVPTLVFVLNGAGFGAAVPDDLTATAALVLRAAKDEVIELPYPAVTTPGVVFGLERQIESLSQGQPIGIVGFSAGGTLAARLAGDNALNVKAVLDYYGPPDLRDFLDYHQGDRYASYVLQRIDANPAVINLLSGPVDTQAHMVAAFGLADHNVVASQNGASFLRDYPGGQVYDYDGPHGVPMTASPMAVDDFLTHL